MQPMEHTDPKTDRGLISLAVFVVICLAVSAAGGAITVTSVSDWYTTLNKPSFNPPDWIFGPVWTVLYLMIAVAGWRVWRRTSGKQRRQAMIIYALQLALNLAWSFLFFGLESPGLAALDIIALLCAIVVNALVFWRIDRLAGALFMPYAAWVAFATLLNISIWQLN